MNQPVTGGGVGAVCQNGFADAGNNTGAAQFNANDVTTSFTAKTFDSNVAMFSLGKVDAQSLLPSS